ncbi:MAG: hypothetical protein Satyrvirus29_13 [Satyrvirus sp.]|uniref:Uncharacterized protein n=1 Tax=Satyrvirus sp. TaxID=2487771 RepID=A0A3G5AER1_9VIRU|nr:MAG: hypothetical protein Satyrvirus29_13 [Satyrvirus sp.]
MRLPFLIWIKIEKTKHLNSQLNFISVVDCNGKKINQ